jgi:hypothetical protein
MIDNSPITPTTTRRHGLPRLGFPRLAIGASLIAMSRLIGDAFTMAYVAPYNSRRQSQVVVPEDDLGGRDANW